MSSELEDAISNSEYLLEYTLPHFDAGKLDTFEEASGFAALYRRRGTAKLLIEGTPNPLYIGAMQSAAAYLFALPRIPEDEKATSFAACFWDAVAGQYWDAAGQIAALSRMSHNAAKEHEDDFSYVAFVMQRYFLGPETSAPQDELDVHRQAQRDRLDRWEIVLEGDLDPRLDLCHALLEQDEKAFEDAIETMAEHRDDQLLRRHKKKALQTEDMAWMQPIWLEGLALLRLASRDGFSLEGLEVPRVPPVLRGDNPYRFDPNAWRVFDPQVVRRSP